ncbi:MAG TPA: Cache 3/Cache 2 fusion domain-containing protein [Bacteroidia bacterium]|nr:Cache 3/Cache 2 fusion domain-containing protein [Bacteroidia bacterium]HRS59846.1 Cache 3/Cache 2 fusion domain-containing protein [Bacteroidia bacterium]HRU68902.1 Cache 3/Cache 2 fusion domain-containing protein [Bacteroidia bacterium]
MIKSIFRKIPIRFELFLPILAAVLISIFVLTILIINKSRENFRENIEKDLSMQVNTIVKMLRREKALKLENAVNDLKVAHYIFYRNFPELDGENILVSVENQESGLKHQTLIKNWKWNSRPLLKDSVLVDTIRSLTGSTATVFQRIDSGFLRISTNVRSAEGTRAHLTYIPLTSPVAQEILSGRNYLGRAYVVNDWYITAYEPIFDKGEITGMLYVGKREKDMKELQLLISSIKTGKSGFFFLIDENGEFLINPPDNQNLKINPDALAPVLTRGKGIFYYREKNKQHQHILAYEYFPDFKIYAAALIDEKVEEKELTGKIIFFSSITGLFVVMVITLSIYTLTRKRIYQYLKKLEESDQKLKTASEALKESEKQFQTLFNNTSDDIFVIDFEGKFLEVNDSACNNLGYSREEMLKKRFSDIKTPPYVNSVRENLEIIKQRGVYQYESEHLSKDGRVIPVEMKSRKIFFRGREVILTIARDITDRKKAEQKIISTIVETEERERKRFAADLHDVLAPILTTIKLFTDLIIKGETKKISQEEIIRNIDELVDQAITTTKEISNNIRPNVLQDFGLAVAIRDFCAYINKTRSVKIQLLTQNYTITKRGIEETILYQTVKELINNTLKHAQAENITIDLKSYKDQIILYYRDDGKGFEIEKTFQEKSGLGINNIYNKIKSIKGNIDFNSSPGNGMFVLITVKLTEQE